MVAQRKNLSDGQDRISILDIFQMLNCLYLNIEFSQELFVLPFSSVIQLSKSAIGLRICSVYSLLEYFESQRLICRMDTVGWTFFNLSISDYIINFVQFN